MAINLAGKVSKSYLSKFGDKEFIIFKVLIDAYDPDDPFAMAREVRVEIIPQDLNMINIVDAFKASAKQYSAAHHTPAKDENDRILNGFVGKFVHFTIGEKEVVDNDKYKYINYYLDKTAKPVMNDIEEYVFECEDVPVKQKKKGDKKEGKSSKTFRL